MRACPTRVGMNPLSSQQTAMRDSLPHARGDEMSFKTKLADLPLIIQEMIYIRKLDVLSDTRVCFKTHTPADYASSMRMQAR